MNRTRCGRIAAIAVGLAKISKSTATSTLMAFRVASSANNDKPGPGVAPAVAAVEQPGQQQGGAGLRDGEASQLSEHDLEKLFLSSA